MAYLLINAKSMSPLSVNYNLIRKSSLTSLKIVPPESGCYQGLRSDQCKVS